MNLSSRRVFVCLAALAWLVCPSPAPAHAADELGPAVTPELPVHSVYDWPSEVVDLFSRIPIQDGGRIKPLSTFARFKLLNMSGGTSLRLPDDFESKRLTATRWLLDCLFFPNVARRLRCFEVPDEQVLLAVGHKVEGRRKRDRYSYDELLPARPRLMEAARRYSEIESKDHSLVQAQTLRLATGIVDFERIVQLADVGRYPIPTSELSSIHELFGKRDEVYFSDVLGNAVPLRDLALSARGGGEEVESPFLSIFHELDVLSAGASGLRLLPPLERESQEWLAVGDLYRAAFESEEPLDRHLEWVSDIERMAALAVDVDADQKAPTISDVAAFTDRARDFGDSLRVAAEQRGEYGTIPTEVSFYRGKFFFINPWFFLVGFLLVGLAWLAPRMRGLVPASWAVTTISVVLLSIGITLRCIIRGRPPVSTLYETILFITAVGVIVCLVVEWLTRRRIALGVASFMGSLGMFLANKYELHDKVDTMPSLVAVLDTNFWLSTHVTTVVIGYSAGLFAAALGHVYLIAWMAGLRNRDPEMLRALGRMVYGLLCFGLVTATVGTILGGIWANDSWGRFWGWDPKENGALLIVLSQLMVLHARLGGYVRDFGISVGAVLSGWVVVFSWWGVNLLGVGLHSYGFTTGAMYAMFWFYGIETVFMLTVAAVALGRRFMGAGPTAA